MKINICDCGEPEIEKSDLGNYWCVDCGRSVDTPEPDEYVQELTDEEIQELENMKEGENI